MSKIPATLKNYLGLNFSSGIAAPNLNFYLFVEAGKAPLVLANDLRFELSGAVQRPLVGQYRFGAAAVAVLRHLLQAWHRP
jgi:hypothetical protein